MTVLTACETASKLMGLSAPSVVYGSVDSYARELAAIANESAKAIAKAHDWRLLTSLASLTGDGSDTSFALPTDYDRMPVKARVFSSTTLDQLQPARDLDEWLDMQLRSFVGAHGVWVILGGQFQILPAPATGELVKFYYIVSKIVEANDDSLKTDFTVDTDSFRLSERLLALDIVWRWRAMKKLDYQEEMRNFEIAMAQEVIRDKGSRMLAIGAVRMPDDVNYAYPWSINAP